MTTHFNPIPLDDYDDTTPDYAPEMPLAFDADGRPVKVAHPAYEPPPAPNAIREARLDAIRGFLEMVSAYGDAEDIGRRVIFMAYLCNAKEFKSQAEVASYLRITPARASQLMAEIAKDFPSLGRLKHRQRQRKFNVAP
jgi:hypothetical protein